MSSTGNRMKQCGIGSNNADTVILCKKPLEALEMRGSTMNMGCNF